MPTPQNNASSYARKIEVYNRAKAAHDSLKERYEKARDAHEGAQEHLLVTRKRLTYERRILAKKAKVINRKIKRLESLQGQDTTLLGPEDLKKQVSTINSEMKAIDSEIVDVLEHSYDSFISELYWLSDSLDYSEKDLRIAEANIAKLRLETHSE